MTAWNTELKHWRTPGQKNKMKLSNIIPMIRPLIRPHKNCASLEILVVSSFLPIAMKTNSYDLFKKLCCRRQ